MADGSGVPYSNGRIITVNSDLKLYAQWENTKGYYRLSYNYGVSEPAIKAYDEYGNPVYRYEDYVDINDNIGILPILIWTMVLKQQHIVYQRIKQQYLLNKIEWQLLLE